MATGASIDHLRDAAERVAAFLLEKAGGRPTSVSATRGDRRSTEQVRLPGGE